jgi:uncharacterized membrane protein
MTSYYSSYNDERAARLDPISNVNVGKTERYASLLAGLGLIYLISRQRNPLSLLTVLAGMVAGKMFYRGTTGHCMIYQAIGVSTAVKTNAQNVSVPHQQGIHVHQTVTINRPITDVYDFWHDFERLPSFMSHLESVEVFDETRSRWTAKAPAGLNVNWEAEIVNDIPNEVIAWRSLPDSQIANAGSVRFAPAPGGRGTEVRVELEYVPPAGKLGVAIARLLGEEPTVQVQEDLRRLKQLLEGGNAGETASAEGQDYPDFPVPDAQTSDG